MELTKYVLMWPLVFFSGAIETAVKGGVGDSYDHGDAHGGGFGYGSMQNIANGVDPRGGGSVLRTQGFGRGDGHGGDRHGGGRGAWN